MTELDHACCADFAALCAADSLDEGDRPEAWYMLLVSNMHRAAASGDYVGQASDGGSYAHELRKP
jgi:hypothetical protein